MKELILFLIALIGSLLIIFSFLAMEIRGVGFRSLGIGSLTFSLFEVASVGF